MSYNTETEIPSRPSQFGSDINLRSNAVGRQNLVVCSFYTRIGACRHGERCSKKHIKPSSSNTIMLANIYQNPKIRNTSMNDESNEVDTEESKEVTGALLGEAKDGEKGEDDPTEEEIQEYFDQFYADVFVHISQMRPIYKLSVCENQNDHLNGNVYVQFFSEEDASYVNRQLNSEWFNERPVYSELSPVSDFDEAHCRAYDNGGCDRDWKCNYMHVRQPTEELFDELFRCQQKSAFQKRLGDLKEMYSDIEVDSSIPSTELSNDTSLGTSALLEQLS